MVTGRDVDGLHHVSFEGKNGVGRGTIFGGDDLVVGYATTIGANSFIHGPLSIGRYCQLGPAVAIYGRDHPMSYVTTYINRNLFEGRLNEHSKQQRVEVENDVWIGHGAILLKGIRVGNGAIIGAGSVVTKSVPAYSVVAGNPARVIRSRFSPAVVELLQKLQWWNLPEAELKHLEPLFHVDSDEDEKKMIRLLENFSQRKIPLVE